MSGDLVASAVQSVEQPSVEQMIQAGIQAGLAPDALEKLFALYERAQARAAAQACTEALMRVQAEMPAIRPDKSVYTKAGTLKYRFVSFPHMWRTAQPILERHGFSVSFEQSIDHPTNTATTVMTVTHIGRHSFERRWSGRVAKEDHLGNSLQQDGSASSYGKRYTFRDGFNIQTLDEDDDGDAGGRGRISDNDVAWIETRAADLGVAVQKLCKFLNVDQVTTIQPAQMPKVQQWFRDAERAVAERAAAELRRSAAAAGRAP